MTNLESANLANATLDETRLRWARLRDANLFLAFLYNADLQETNLDGAYFEGALLEGARLTFTSLSGTDLRGAQSIEDIYWYGVMFDRTQLTRDQLGGAIGEERDRQWLKAREAYMAVKNNFEQIGRYSDASWAYRKERRMEKREAWQKAKEAYRGRQWWQAGGRGLKAAGDQLVEWVSDYGEGVWRVIATLTVVWLSFALLYGAICGVWGPWQETASQSVRHVTRNIVHLLTFSLGAMTTVEPPGLEARETLAMQILMPSQALLGIILAGLLGFVLGNRIRRS